MSNKIKKNNNLKKRAKIEEISTKILMKDVLGLMDTENLRVFITSLISITDTNI